jgi:hypothetical protein
MVTGKDEHVVGVILLDEIDVLVNCVCCALIPIRRLASLVRRKNGKSTSHTVKIPRCTVANVFVKCEGLILGKNTYCVNTGVNAV